MKKYFIVLAMMGVMSILTDGVWARKDDVWARKDDVWARKDDVWARKDDVSGLKLFM